MERTWVTVEGNEAVANIAHTLSEIIAIYPITPSTPMGELADAWSATGRPNLWGTVPLVVEMQSEGGQQEPFMAHSKRDRSSRRSLHRRDCS